ncbi:MAG: hypothetical protein VKN33_03485 [Candidatus Sericytochromatia bacterium]|nr:hypothetical protein [Candidatus Sericytochromatia bacterium]
MKALKFVTVAALGWLVMAPTPSEARPAAHIAFLFGPDDDTIQAFEKLKADLEAYEKALAVPLKAQKCYDLAHQLYKDGSPEFISGEQARSHPDWSSMAQKVDAVIAYVQSVQTSTVVYHPGLGVMEDANIKLYNAIQDRANLEVASPEEMLVALGRLSNLGSKPEVKAMLAAYRRSEGQAIVKEKMSEYLTMVREDFVHLSQASGPLARTDAKKLELRIKTLFELGEKGDTPLLLADDPLAPLESNLGSILAVASRRAAGQPASDALSKAAQKVQLKAENYNARVRAFAYENTRGKPKAEALLREYGLPTTTRTGPNGTVQWLYRYTQNNIGRVRILTISPKDGSLLNVKERFQ